MLAFQTPLQTRAEDGKLKELYSVLGVAEELGIQLKQSRHSGREI
jgi:hypothetical protein